MTIQYTISCIPSSVDEALRRLAEQQHKSLNAVAVECLAKGLEMETSRLQHTDLDDLIGTWVEDPEFDQAVAEFSKVTQEDWK